MTDQAQKLDDHYTQLNRFAHCMGFEFSQSDLRSAQLLSSL
jgi:hypothetical protein